MMWSLGNERVDDVLQGAGAQPAGEDGSAMAYWYNISTGRVESDENRSQNADVMGPYETEAEAAAALATAREKTERWDEEDRREREWRDGDAEA